MIFHRFLLIFYLVCLTVSGSLQAAQIQVVDQFGDPVEGAVIHTDLPDMTTNINALAIMDQVNKKFLPEVLIINKGQQVSFPNSDNIRHHVYSFSAIKPFEIKLYKETPTLPILFDKAGIVALGCNIHDSMIGYIYVSDGFKTFVTNERGFVDMSDTVKNVTLWHAKQLGNISDVVHVKIDNALAKQRISLKLRKPKVKTTNKFKSRFQ